MIEIKTNDVLKLEDRLKYIYPQVTNVKAYDNPNNGFHVIVKFSLYNEILYGSYDMTTLIENTSTISSEIDKTLNDFNLMIGENHLQEQFFLSQILLNKIWLTNEKTTKDIKEIRNIIREVLTTSTSFKNTHNHFISLEEGKDF